MTHFLAAMLGVLVGFALIAGGFFAIDTKAWWRWSVYRHKGDFHDLTPFTFKRRAFRFARRARADGYSISLDREWPMRLDIEVPA